MAASWDTGGRMAGVVARAAVVFEEMSRRGACIGFWEGRCETIVVSCCGVMIEVSARYSSS